MQASDMDHPHTPHAPSKSKATRHREHSSKYRFPVRGCCVCRTWSRLGDWNPIPLETDELCFACQHTACSKCKDRWASSEENIIAAERFRQNHRDGCAREREHSEITPWVVDVIKKHSQQWRDDHKRGECGPEQLPDTPACSGILASPSNTLLCGSFKLIDSFHIACSVMKNTIATRYSSRIVHNIRHHNCCHNTILAT